MLEITNVYSGCDQVCVDGCIIGHICVCGDAWYFDPVTGAMAPMQSCERDMIIAGLLYLIDDSILAF